jgi:putative tryptophan/tyrosine transport system substrate-binding protein
VVLEPGGHTLFDPLRRRELIALLGGAAAAPSILWPLAARGQQPGRVRRVGVLMNYAEVDPISRSHLVLFEQTLRDLGWIDGQNLRIDYRWSAGDADLAHTYAAELAGLSADVILASSTMNLAALQLATATTPIVFVGSPIRSLKVSFRA